MEFIKIDAENFEKAIALRPRCGQYRFMPRATVLYSLGRAYIAVPPYEVMPFVIANSGSMIGSVRLRNYGHGVGVAAFFIDHKYQRRGYATMAVKSLQQFIPKIFPKATEIELCVHQDNSLARRLFEKSGFQYTGVVNEDGTLDMEMAI